MSKSNQRPVSIYGEGIRSRWHILGNILGVKSKTLFMLFSCIYNLSAQKFQTPYELSNKKSTATYKECADWYRKINAAFPECTYFDSIGMGDVGLPIFAFRIYKSENTPKLKVLINNNIHPGEPEGTDASMLLAREILLNQIKYQEVLQKLDIHIICQYNVDGTLNQSCCTRANQDGPVNQGFRGNARNLDLNRDFVKMDSRNAKNFVIYFTKNKFNILIDNHTSNGADYQYTLTYFHTRPEKIAPALANWLLPFDKKLASDLEKNGYPISPYVETVKHVPDSGIFAFWESGRYATGFAALHHCIGYTVETHMLKPFPQRVAATMAFMKALLQNLAVENQCIVLFNATKNLQNSNELSGSRIEKTQYQLDMKRADTISFLGYGYSYKNSKVTGLPRLFYDREKPWNKRIPYYRYFLPSDSINLPKYYIIPYAWGDVTSRLEMNGIKLKRNTLDTEILARVSYINSYESVKNPYEGHYLHFGVHTRDTVLRVQLRKGDFIAIVSNSNRVFLSAVLEPRSPDSYFNWNCFDAILQQKEGYSDYVWEDKAEEILNTDTALLKLFYAKKALDEKFKSNAGEQLNWIYKHSSYYERTHNLYPVYRID